MFNRNRQLRECTNQLLCFDPFARTIDVVKTTGYGAGSRRSHSATLYENSMIIYGGQSETGHFYNEMLSLDMTTMEWSLLDLKKGLPPFT